ncbi:MAG: carboxyl transferase domain-containing protein, partial [Acidimicrobiales bacterium]
MEGRVSIAIEQISGRPAVVARSDPSHRRGALSEADSATLAEAGALALSEHIPLVWFVASSGADIEGGIAALHGWGQAARVMADCSGVVPVVMALVGPAISGPALMLGLADVVIMTPDAFAFISGPDMVAEFTGVTTDISELGGRGVHSRLTGLAALEAADAEDAYELVAEVLSY